MSLLRRLRRKHRPGRSKTHSAVGLDKSTVSNEHASSRDRLTTQRAPAGRAGRSVSRLGESDTLTSCSFRTEEASSIRHRTSPASEVILPPTNATILDRIEVLHGAEKRIPKFERNHIRQDTVKSNWLLKARIASFVLAAISALVAGSAAALGFTMVFALVCDMFMCKLHRRTPKTFCSAEDDSVSSECVKSLITSDQNFSSDMFISSEGCANLTPLPGVTTMDFQSPIDNAALKKLRKLYGLSLVDPSASASDSEEVSTRNVMSEYCSGSPEDSSSGKLRTRLKSKSLLKHLHKKEQFSAPSSPMGSRHDYKSPFSDASRVSENALNRAVVRGKLGCSAYRPSSNLTPLDLLSDQEVSHTPSRRVGKQLARPVSSLHEEKRRKKPAQIRPAWIIGLLITIGGLFGGRMVATVGLVSWWLLLSKVSGQPAVCEQPTKNNSVTQVTQ